MLEVVGPSSKAPANHHAASKEAREEAAHIAAQRVRRARSEPIQVDVMARSQFGKSETYMRISMNSLGKIWIPGPSGGEQFPHPS